MRNGCKNLIRDTRSQESNRNTKPLCSLSYGTQEGDDEQARQAVVKTYTASIVIIAGLLYHKYMNKSIILGIFRKENRHLCGL